MLTDITFTNLAPLRGKNLSGNSIDGRNFDSLYDAYAPPLYGTLLSWLKDEYAAQVMLQQTFESYIHDHLPTGCEHEKPFICLIRIARKKFNALKAQEI